MGGNNGFNTPKIDINRLREDLGVKQSNEKIRAEPRAYLVNRYVTFKSTMNVAPVVVYQPGCGYDKSASDAFPGSRVIYVDPDTQAVESLKLAGCEAYAEDANTFDPGPVDILILHNSGSGTEVPASHVKDEGYILCNDHFGVASALHRDERYELIGHIFETSENAKPIFDRERIQDYWKIVETNGEFEKVAPHMFIIAQKLIVELGEYTGDLLNDYKRVTERLQRGEIAEASAVHVDEDGTTFMYRGRVCTLFALPPKAGNTDDIFVFRK